MNIGPTQQSIEANHVYQRDAIARANQSNGSGDDCNWLLACIDLFMLFMPVMAVGMSLKEYVDFDVQWQVWVFWIIEIFVLALTSQFTKILRAVAITGIVGTIIYAIITHY